MMFLRVVSLMLVVFFLNIFQSDISIAARKDGIKTLNELLQKYDSTRCKECHQEIYEQWETSHHARSLMGLDDWIFMTPYLQRGVLAVKEPSEATRANFPCAKCHLPQLQEATDGVASELAAAILRDDKATIGKLNIGCLVCHNAKAAVHFRPEEGVIYGSRDLREHTKEYPSVKESSFMKSPLFCGQCHGLGPNLEFDIPVQCATIYGSYLHAYIPAGGSRTCQDCHMPDNDHACLPNFNNRDQTSARLREALRLEVDILPYSFQPKEGTEIPMIVLRTGITSSAGHRIPDG